MSEGALNAVGWMCAGKALFQSLAAINFPMFLLFESPGELRNLSLLYVGFVFMLGYTLNGAAPVLGRRAHPENSRADLDSSSGSALTPPGGHAG